MGFDLTELEQFERLTSYVMVEHRGEWCQVLMRRGPETNESDGEPDGSPPSVGGDDLSDEFVGQRVLLLGARTLVRGLSHSMTWSARTNTDGGIVSPGAFASLRFDDQLERSPQ
jgi:hypothetical protein